jgi:hypothetical protein
MSKYMSQGNKDMDVGVKAPMRDKGMDWLIKEAGGKTVGITGDKGIGKDGLPLKPYPPKAGK